MYVNPDSPGVSLAFMMACENISKGDAQFHLAFLHTCLSMCLSEIRGLQMNTSQRIS